MLSCAIDSHSRTQVIYDDGIIVRSTASIESGAVVKIATPGSILKATGKVSGKV